MRPQQLLRVRAVPGARQRGWLFFGGQVYPCALGRAGITRAKREGDGGTPAGSLSLLRVLYRADKIPRPRTGLPIRAIQPDDGWCDAAADRNYNRPVRLPYPASHERMRRDDNLYDIVVVLDWNLSRRRKGKGSAIFLHLARPGFLPTEGCVAVTAPVMRRLLSGLRPGARINIAG